MPNPFRVGERVTGAEFTDRAVEVRAVVNAMRERGRLLLYGPRRMGKSTLIGVAAQRLRRQGALVLEVDLATITTLTEASDRLLAAVSRESAWHARLLEWVQALAPQVTLGADATGQPRLSVGLDARPRREESERALLERVLDRLDAVASERSAPTVVVLDEVQRLSELGGESAEWLLRNRMQEHRHVAWICAGSKESLIAEMLEPGRAFYHFFEQLHVGAIEPLHLARWIDERLSASGIAADDVGAAIIGAAGPRTQDIMLVARTLWFRRQGAGQATVADVVAAVREIVAADDAALRRTWEDLTPVQQRLLRAVAAGEAQVYASATRDLHELGPASSVGTALAALIGRGILLREDSGIGFENPFMREWVRDQAMR